MATIRIGQEVGDKKTFVWVIDWPGWSRGGKTIELAVAALLEATPRYAVVAETAGLELPSSPKGLELETIESVPGSAGTDFGIPYGIADDDRRPVTAKEAKRQAALVEAAWTVFDRVAAKAPPTLRKGPRGGGRDRDKMIDHVIDADHAYAREMGIRLPQPSRADRAAIEAERAAVLELLRTRSDGSPLAGRKWPPRYAARRIAWHALDHAWEMEDRSEPAS
jgi:hypothetical protein